MDAARFWSIIEEVWQEIGEFDQERQVFLAQPSYETQPSNEALDAFISRLWERLEQFTAADLVAFDLVLERSLYDLDREEIHDYTDGSDDGFLYCRGFIVAMGREYCEAVGNQPSLAILDAELEQMCYMPVHIYEEKFGEFPVLSGISRETGSNDRGWLEESGTNENRATE